jgi:hypothetical protein
MKNWVEKISSYARKSVQNDFDFSRVALMVLPQMVSPLFSTA